MENSPLNRLFRNPLYKKIAVIQFQQMMPCLQAVPQLHGIIFLVRGGTVLPLIEIPPLVNLRVEDSAQKRGPAIHNPLS